MRQGKVFVEDVFAGVISEIAGSFIFEYDEVYLQKENALPVSITLPLRKENIGCLQHTIRYPLHW